MNCVYRIYSIKPTITESYIGSTMRLKLRVALHKTCAKKPTPRVSEYIGHHGFEHFIFEVLEELETYDRKKLAEREAHYFKLFKPKLNMNIPNRSHKQYSTALIIPILRAVKPACTTRNIEKNVEQALKSSTIRTRRL